MLNYAIELRRELAARNKDFAARHGLPKQDSYGELPVVCYEPFDGGHGNFIPQTYRAIVAHPNWSERLKKAHTSARRALPRNERGFWAELDSCMSSDALLMNCFCYPGALTAKVRSLLGVEADAEPRFGMRARVPLANGRVDRTEVDMQLGSLLVEAKLTEADFQAKPADELERYRDFAEVFDREMLPKSELREVRARQRVAAQPIVPGADDVPHIALNEDEQQIGRCGQDHDAVGTSFEYKSYQLIRNVLAAHATGSSFCVLLDARRPDLVQSWYDVMRCVRNEELRVRCKVLTWQELATALPPRLTDFLDEKYGITPADSEYTTQHR